MPRNIIIVGGGTAGWISAAYMARMLSANLETGVKITLIESPDIGTIGVGEGTFPSIRKTLSRIGLSEAELIRDANATLKQGIRFVDWRVPPTNGRSEHYLHPFQIVEQSSGLDLLPYWLAGVAGNRSWADASTVQASVVYDSRAPKLITHGDYAAPLNYAYHFDAAAFSVVLRKRALEQGVKRIVDTVDEVRLTEDGAIASLMTREHGEQTADIYIDCSGFRAQLIGKAMNIPFQSCRDQLFTDRAVAIQVPYRTHDATIPSYTISTAQEAGWTWDIGLTNRRGVGYVYSSAHTTDERAEQVLRRYIGSQADGLDSRLINFEPGYRHIQWHKNCVAIGLSSGFIEPLEATGIGFAEIASVIFCGLFPWAGPIDFGAKQFNAQMNQRYKHVLDFIKLHYCITQRRDSDFWTDNTAYGSISESLAARLETWRYRPPSFLDVDLKHDIFTEHNWQYVLYGMGFKTDLGDRIGALKFFDDARAEFANIQKQSAYALKIMPRHRDLIEQVRQHGFMPKTAA